MNFKRTGWRRILLAANVTDIHRERKRGKAHGVEAVLDEQRTALFVAEGILRSRLSPETFITARRLLGITNVFDENDVDVPAITFPREPARRFAESGIHMDKEAIGPLARQRANCTFRHLSASFVEFLFSLFAPYTDRITLLAPIRVGSLPNRVSINWMFSLLEFFFFFLRVASN